MKSFTEHVKLDQEAQGLHVFRVPKYKEQKKQVPIDLIAMKNGKVTTFIRARKGGYDKPNSMTILRMQMLGKQCGALMLHASMNSKNQIVYKTIYENSHCVL